MHDRGERRVEMRGPSSGTSELRVARTRNAASVRQGLLMGWGARPSAVTEDRGVGQFDSAPGHQRPSRHNGRLRRLTRPGASSARLPWAHSGHLRPALVTRPQGVGPNFTWVDPSDPRRALELALLRRGPFDLRRYKHVPRFQLPFGFGVRPLQEADTH